MTLLGCKDEHTRKCKNASYIQMISSLLKYLPASLWARIEHRHNLLKILDNSGWLFADKILRMGVGLFVGVWVARYLGPEQFGLLNFAIAIVALFGTVAGLGLSGIVVRDLVQKPDGTSITLGTAFVLQMIGGFLAFALAVAVVSIIRTDDDLARAIVAILGFALVFKSATVAKYWFESKVLSKYTVWVENGVFLFMAAIRVGLILIQAPLLAFVWAALAETVLASTILLIVYSRKAGRLSNWRASMTRAKALLLESWPVILVASASMINMRLDQVMLGTMVDNTVVGNYSAAVRLAEVWLILPAIIGPSIYPAIIAAKKVNNELYRKRILQVTKSMIIGVIPVAVIITLLSGQIVHLIFGKQFILAGDYLALYIWTGVPYLIFFVLNQMFYIESLLKVGLVISIFTVASNIVLNFILIPIYGGIGAVIATLITTISSTLLSLIILNSKTGIFLKSQRAL